MVGWWFVALLRAVSCVSLLNGTGLATRSWNPIPSTTWRSAGLGLTWLRGIASSVRPPMFGVPLQTV